MLQGCFCFWRKFRGIVDYLLFGIGPNADNKSYEERLEEPYARFEKEVAKHDPSPSSKLLDLSNELTSEKATERMPPESSAFNTNTTILEGMYKERVERALKEVLEKDEKYCRVNEEKIRRLKI